MSKSPSKSKMYTNAQILSFIFDRLQVLNKSCDNPRVYYDKSDVVEEMQKRAKSEKP